MKSDGSIIIDTKVDTKGIQEGTKKVQGMFDGLIKSAKTLGAAIAGAFAVKQIIAFSRECIELGSALDEVQNVVDVTFGRNADKINDWAKEAATNFGESELAAKQYASTIGAMFKSMGVNGDELVEMSESMAGLAGDIASFYNLDTDTAFNKIRSGIAGITMPLQQLGINMSEVNLEQFRISQGMAKAYKDMNQQEKAILRYKYLLSVTSDAQGDFARTSSSWANQTRILSLNLQSLKADLGKGLINVLTPVLQVINRILSGLAKLASAFRSFTELLTGKKASSTGNTGAVAQQAEDAATATNDLADATKKNAKATKQANKESEKYVSGLDKIHRFSKEDTATVTPQTGTASKASTPAASNVDFGQLAQGETALEKVDKKMQEVINRIKKAIEPLKQAFSGLLATLKAAFGWILQNILIPLGKWTVNEVLPRFFLTLANIINIFNNVLLALKPLWMWFWENLLQPIAKFVGDAFLKFWDLLNAALGKFADWCKEHPKTIENIAIVLASFFAAWKIVTLTEKIVTFVSTVSNMIRVLGGLKSVIGILVEGFNPWILIIGAVIAAGVLLWKNWDTISKKAKEIWGGISSYLKRTWETIKKNFSSSIATVRSVIDKGWNAIRTVSNTVWNGIRSGLSAVWSGIKTAASTAWNGITGVVSGALTRLATTAAQVGTSVFNALSGAFKKVANAIKTPINGIIGLMNGLIRGIVGGINACTGALNKLKINIPNWVPVYGGKKLGFNIPKLYAPQIPYLATGAVIPPNSPFTAVLGDQKRGNNIEAPESLIRKIVREEGGGSNNKYEFKAVLNRRVLFDQIIDEARLRQQQTGNNPFVMA